MARTRSHSFLPHEDQLIIEAVAKYPFNFQAAFELVTTQTNRTLNSVNQRWYKYIRHTSPTVLLGSVEVLIKNTKNIIRYDGADIDIAIAVQTLLSNRTSLMHDLDEATKAKLRELLA